MRAEITSYECHYAPQQCLCIKPIKQKTTGFTQHLLRQTDLSTLLTITSPVHFAIEAQNDFPFCLKEAPQFQAKILLWEEGGSLLLKDAITKEGNAILEFFNLQNSDAEKVDVSSKGDTLYSDVELVKRIPLCKHCGMSQVRLKETTIKLIKHSNVAGRKCVIRYHAHRYLCKCCGRTFFEDNPFVFKAQKISVLTISNILEDLKNPAETFSNVGKRYGISPTSVASIFDEHVAMPRLPLPSYLCIDESYSFKSEKSNYVCMFVNFENGDPIDVLPSRRKETLIEYFSRLPLEERRNVKIVGMDMWDTYRSVVKRFFPRAICSADHYHIKQDMNRKADRIRIRVMKRYTPADIEYYLLKHFNWLLFKHKDSKDKDGNLLLDPERPRKFNQRLKKDLNFYEILELIKCIDSELTEAIVLTEKCHDFYENSTYDTAEKNLKKLIGEFRAAQSDDMRAFGETLAVWKQEVINSFIVVNNEYSINPADGQVVSRKIKVNNSIMLSAGYFYPHLFYFGR